MIVRELQLAQVRGLEEASFSFEPGMNLLVGINGAGKSTALDALRILLAQVLPGLAERKARMYPEGFEPSDVRFDAGFLTARIEGEVGKASFAYLVHRTFSDSTPDTTREGEVRDQVHETPERDEWVAASPGEPASLGEVLAAAGDLVSAPLAVYFGPQRSVVSREKDRRKGDAYSQALQSRPLRVRDLADWWRATDTLAGEYEEANRQEEAARERRVLSSLESAVGIFFAGRYSNLRGSEDGDSVVLDRDGKELDIGQLSDGERGVLALVSDLTRRLTLANPGLEDPVGQARAVVLIDEVDLHLHPGWQREIIRRLTDTFPRCQFICTTHSPHAISEVRAEAVQYLVWEEGESGPTVRVRRRDQSYGLDSNWILEFLMDAPVEPEWATDLYNRIEDALDEDDFVTARELVQELRERSDGDSGKIARIEGSIIALEAISQEDAPDEDDPEA